MKQRIVLLGPPASGKGTQADRLAAAFGIPHVSTGALLRSECERGTPLGREADAYTRNGGLVPDELAIRIVTNWMAAHGTRFLFDGFPRTLGQAESLDAALAELRAPLDLIVFLDLGEEEIRRRILDRLTCLSCGATFASSLHGLAVGDPCPRCKQPVVRRKDDSAGALGERMKVYRELTLPVVEYYGRNAPRLLHRVPAGKGSDAIFDELSRLVAGGVD